MQLDDDKIGSRMKYKYGCVAKTTAVGTFQATKEYKHVGHGTLPLILICVLRLHKLEDTTPNEARLSLLKLGYM